MFRATRQKSLAAVAGIAAASLLEPAAITLTLAAIAAPASAQDELVIEEIIVTATRRLESVQDVPVAVTAVTGTMLEDSGVEDFYSLQEQVPALVVNRSQQSTVTTFGIRGIG
ncbi:MAG: TonB-dependent receptor, partial [Woeseiaceae bacterium]